MWRCFLFFFVTLPCLGFANPITTLIQTNLPHTHVGVVVMNAETGKVLYQKNSHQYFSPASNLKLFTAAAALFTLGPNYHYYTKLLQSKENFYLRLTGDPSFKISNLKKLLKYTQSDKKIILVLKHLSGPNYPMGMGLGDSHWYYGTPISAAMLNQNKIIYTLIPGKKLNQPVRLLPGDLASQYAFHTTVKTVTKNQADNQCQLVISMNNKNNLALSGCWPINTGQVKLALAVKNPVLLLKNQIKLITHTKKPIIQGQLPKNTKLIKQYISPSLSKLIKNMLLYSNNIIANSLLKTIGYKISGVGSFQQGVLAEELILHKKLKLNFTQGSIMDGAGMSRYDLVTPSEITQLLSGMYHNKKYKKRFINSLPHSGLSGTLKNRMKNLPGLVIAKTGTAHNVSNLSGYIFTKNHRVLIFSILMNNFVDKLSVARNTQDKICKLLYKGVV